MPDASRNHDLRRAPPRGGSGTSSNSNGVDFRDAFISDPPSQAEVQDVVNKMNELIGTLGIEHAARGDWEAGGQAG